MTTNVIKTIIVEIEKRAERHALQYDNEADRTWSVYDYRAGAESLLPVVEELLEQRDKWIESDEWDDMSSEAEIAKRISYSIESNNAALLKLLK